MSAELAALVIKGGASTAARRLMARIFNRPDLDRITLDWVRDFLGELGERLRYVEGRIQELDRKPDLAEATELAFQAIATAEHTANAEKRRAMANAVANALLSEGSEPERRFLSSAARALDPEHVALLTREVSASFDAMRYQVRAKAGDLEAGLLHQLASWQFVRYVVDDGPEAQFALTELGVRFLRFVSDPRQEPPAAIVAWDAKEELHGYCAMLNLGVHELYDAVLSCRLDDRRPLVRLQKGGDEFEWDVNQMRTAYHDALARWTSGPGATD